MPTKSFGSRIPSDFSDPLGGSVGADFMGIIRDDNSVAESTRPEYRFVPESRIAGLDIGVRIIHVYRMLHGRAWSESRNREWIYSQGITCNLKLVHVSADAARRGHGRGRGSYSISRGARFVPARSLRRSRRLAPVGPRRRLQTIDSVLLGA